jgi:hypothetical protein
LSLGRVDRKNRLVRVNSQQSTINHQLSLIETHAHLDYQDFENDFDDVLRRATEADVTRIITIGTSVESSRRAVDLAEKYPNVFAVIGVHPTYAEEASVDVITPLRELAKNKRVVAIGEAGLDYHRLPSVEAGKQKNRATPKNKSRRVSKMEPTNRNRPSCSRSSSISQPSSA